MKNVCQKCGRNIRPGQVAYQVKIELISMPDEHLEEPEEDIDLELERLIQAVSRQDPIEAAKDVAQTIVLVLCRKCRNILVKEYDIQEAPVFH